MLASMVRTRSGYSLSARALSRRKSRKTTGLISCVKLILIQEHSYPWMHADTFIGACVRATRRGDGAVQLYRADAQYLLRSRAILVFVLIHVVEDERRAYYRFVDREFAWRLATFHRSGRTKMSVKLLDCRTEHGFRKDLIQALQPGFVEGVSLSLAEQGLKQLIAGATVEIQRGANGQLTLALLLLTFSITSSVSPKTSNSLFTKRPSASRSSNSDASVSLPLERGLSRTSRSFRRHTF